MSPETLRDLAAWIGHVTARTSATEHVRIGQRLHAALMEEARAEEIRIIAEDLKSRYPKITASLAESERQDLIAENERLRTEVASLRAALARAADRSG